MKLSVAAALLAAPAVMGRACRARSSGLSLVSTPVNTPTSAASSAVASTSALAQELTTVSDSSAEQQSAVVSSASSQTTLSTAVVVSSAKASTTTTTSTAVAASSAAASSAAASSSAASATESEESTSTDSSDTGLGTTTYSGTSTFYGGNLSGGNCMFTTYTLPDGIYGTAYSGDVWDNAAKCGVCIEVTGPSHTITAMIVDQCPECEEAHLDLFSDAFTAIGGSDGEVSTSYKFVECGITSPLILHNKSGTSEYWFSMQVVNHNEPIESLEVSTDGGSTWETTTRSDYNFFENSSGFGVDTMSIRVTSTNGNSITVTDVGVTADAEYTATSNFA